MRKAAMRFTKSQSQILMERFQTNPYVGKEENLQLAKSLNISEESIRIWLHNYRRRNNITKSVLFKGQLVYSMYNQ